MHNHLNNDLKNKDFNPITETYTPLNVQLFLSLQIAYIKHQGWNSKQKASIIWSNIKLTIAIQPPPHTISSFTNWYIGIQCIKHGVHRFRFRFPIINLLILPQCTFPDHVCYWSPNFLWLAHLLTWFSSVEMFG